MNSVWIIEWRHVNPNSQWEPKPLHDYIETLAEADKFVSEANKLSRGRKEFKRVRFDRVEEQ